MELVTVPAPVEPDETPLLEGEAYNPEYPGSTPDAPYGFKPDGSAYRRRPKGTAKKAGNDKRMPASDVAARTAASLLARMNTLVVFSLTAAGLPATGAAIAQGNQDFETMAYEALLTDPALCRKILSAGATSGKTALVMAYGMLTISVIPVAKSEIEARKAANNDE